MFNNLRREHILFLDIETVPLYPYYEDCPPRLRHLWDVKAAGLRSAGDVPPDVLWERAGIYSEFGKVICISTAFFHGEELRVKSFYGHDEAVILEDFCRLIRRYFNRSSDLLCAHNGKEFDFPYLARRIVINGLPLPDMLNLSGRKPWQVPHLDTMELWKFGDHKHYTSLDLLTEILGIPSPKDEINGADVYRVYWKDDDIERIVVYCQKDVVALAAVLMRLNGQKFTDDVVVVQAD